MKKLILLFAFIVTAFSAFAQAANSQMDEVMNSHNKIYVVMTVCLVILEVMLLYLVRIDAKISKKEKTNE